MAAKRKYKDYESALERLEEITAQLESGELSLDESIELYTEGIEISKFCNTKLKDAEKKIKIIIEKNGSKIEQDFETDSGE